MPVFEMYGRYAEDPMVYVDAKTAEEAAKWAIGRRLQISPGYRENGSLIPVAVSAHHARRLRQAERVYLARRTGEGR